MSLLWALPLLVMLAGTAMALVMVRGLAEAAGDLRLELNRFAEVRVAVHEVRAASADLRATSRGLRRT